MFETFSRSWEITKTTFGVMSQDKEIILFPILASIFSILFFIAMVIPFIMSAFATGIIESLGVPAALSELLFIPVVFVLYFGLSFISTFFNVCVVYTAKTRFEGGDSKFLEALGFAFSRIHLIILWSLLSATVGTILRTIEKAGRKAGPLGSLVIGIATSIFGLAWAILTIFVVPSMVFKGTGPIGAIKDSVGVLKKTWGESIVRHYGLGFAEGLIIFLLFIPFVVLAIIGFLVNPIVGFIIIACFVGIIILLSMFFSAANTVFNAALYWYATKGDIPGAYSPEVMQNAFQKKKGFF